MARQGDELVTETPALVVPTNRLDRPVDAILDHAPGPEDALITLVEYGSYDCPLLRQQRATHGDKSAAQVRWPASDSLCRSLSPDRYFPVPAISP